MLGATVFDVPVVVPLAWAMMAYPCYVAATTLSQRPWVIAVIGAWSLMAWDIFLDPMMVELRAWTWHGDTPSLPGIDEIPVQNFAGWFAAGLVITALLLLLPNPRASANQPATLFLWVFASSVVAAAFFFDRPELAVVGGVAMGVVALPYAWRLWDTRTMSRARSTVGRVLTSVGSCRSDPRDRSYAGKPSTTTQPNEVDRRSSIVESLSSSRRATKLRRSVPALKRARSQQLIDDLEILVLDDGSSDGTDQVVRHHIDDIQRPASRHGWRTTLGLAR